MQLENIESSKKSIQLVGSKLHFTHLPVSFIRQRGLIKQLILKRWWEMHHIY